MNLNAAEIAALDQDSQNIGIFLRLDSAPPVRIWLGFAAIEPGVNVLDATLAQYLGFGELRDIPAVKQLLNGAAERVDITLSGVDGSVLQLAALNDVQAIKGKGLHIGIAIMSADFQLLGAVHWCSNYIADYLALEQPPATGMDAGGEIVRTLRLSCGSTFTGRRRPELSFFSNRDQQARSGGDRFCERTPIYANQFNKAWPTFP
jgi:hypothetical protein